MHIFMSVELCTLVVRAFYPNVSIQNCPAQRDQLLSSTNEVSYLSGKSILYKYFSSQFFIFNFFVTLCVDCTNSCETHTHTRVLVYINIHNQLVRGRTHTLLRLKYIYNINVSHAESHVHAYNIYSRK